MYYNIVIINKKKIKFPETYLSFGACYEYKMNRKNLLTLKKYNYYHNKISKSKEIYP